MHVGADHVQADVEGVAHNKNHEEDGNPHRRGQAAAGHGAQDVEHLPDHRAGQHHDHQAGVGEDVPKVPRHAVVDRADHRRHLAEALGAAALGQQHQAAQHQHHRDAGHAAYGGNAGQVQGKQPDARKDHPPGADVPHGIPHLAVPAEHPELDRHAHHNLHEAYRQGKDQHGHGVLHHVEQRGGQAAALRHGEEGDGRLGQAQHAGELHQKVGEKSAG